MARGMRRCPGDGDARVRRCVHSGIYTPLRIVWAAVEVPLGHKTARRDWEGGHREPWAREVLCLPEGYAWASDMILWHVGHEPRSADPKLTLWPVVVSRSVRRERIK
jgi:hypothetical protein